IKHEYREKQREHRHITEDENPHPGLARNMPGALRLTIDIGSERIHGVATASGCCLMALNSIMIMALNQIEKITSGSQNASRPFQAKGPVLKHVTRPAGTLRNASQKFR